MSPFLKFYIFFEIKIYIYQRFKYKKVDFAQMMGFDNTA